MSDPQSGVGGWMPKPRKDSVATVKIAYPRRTENSTSTAGRTLGKISMTITDHAPAPSRRAGRRGVVEMSLGQHGGAYGAGDQRREDEADDDDQRQLRRAEGHDEQEGDHDRGQRQHGLHQPAR